MKVKEQYFHCCSTFHIHRRVFNNEHKSYMYYKMSLKQFYAWSWAANYYFLFLLLKCYICCSDFIWCLELYFLDSGLSRRKQNKTRTVSDTPHLQYYDVQTLEYRYINKLIISPSKF